MMGCKVCSYFNGTRRHTFRSLREQTASRDAAYGGMRMQRGLSMARRESESGRIRSHRQDARNNGLPSVT